MKRTLATAAALFLAALSAFPQATGFGSSGAAGILFQGGDPAQLTQRIMSTTRYKLTPGDIYQLAITMPPSTSTFHLVLQENYDLAVPQLGTLNVRGLYFADVRKMITDGLRKSYPYAEFISLTLESPARFDIVVFGGVLTPGTVTVNATQRVSDALILAGRTLPGASYRTIMLIRGETQTKVDLLRYQLDGTSEEDPFLEPGDKVLVPPAGLIVTLSGQVRYPGAFEMLPGETLATLIGYAGGLLPDANTAQIELIRFAANGTSSRTLLAMADAPSATLANADKVRVPSIAENAKMVLVTGALFGAPVAIDKAVPVPLTPVAINIPWVPGLTLLTVLQALGGPTPYADTRNATILHKATGMSTLFDVEALWTSRDPSRDVVLEPGDTVSIPIVNQVFVTGQVNAPGKLPYDPGYRVTDYIKASGGVNPVTADPNSIWFVGKDGKLTRTGLASPVAPGAVIFVDMNGITKAQQTFDNVYVITGFIGTIVALVTNAVIMWGYVKSLAP